MTMSHLCSLICTAASPRDNPVQVMCSTLPLFPCFCSDLPPVATRRRLRSASTLPQCALLLTQAPLKPWHHGALSHIVLYCITVFSDRTFTVVGPRAWNGLPADVRRSLNLHTSKRALKTRLLKLLFSLTDIYSKFNFLPAVFKLLVAPLKYTLC